MVLEEIQHPIVLAPLAGGASTAELAAAVSEAGGLGFLASGYLTPEVLEERMVSVRERTEAPFGVNLFVPGDPQVETPGLEDYLREREVTDIVLVGLATDYCVLYSVRDAIELGFAVTVAIDGVRAVNLAPGDGERALEEMRALGATLRVSREL
jgi:nicotinamidase-related amidase